MKKIATATIPMKTIKNQKKEQELCAKFDANDDDEQYSIRRNRTEKKTKKKKHGEYTRNTRNAAELIGITTKKNMTLWSRGIPTLQKSSCLRRVVFAKSALSFGKDLPILRF